MAKRKTPREILEAAAPSAARVIAAAVSDPELTAKERYAAACEILGRLYGKSMEQPQDPQQDAVKVVFCGSTEELAQ